MGKNINSISTGVGFVFASIISYSMWKSFWWMFFHGCLSWVYVIYWAIRY